MVKIIYRVVCKHCGFAYFPEQFKNKSKRICKYCSPVKIGRTKDRLLYLYNNIKDYIDITKELPDGEMVLKWIENSFNISEETAKRYVELMKSGFEKDKKKYKIYEKEEDFILVYDIKK